MIACLLGQWSRRRILSIHPPERTCLSLCVPPRELPFRASTSSSSAPSPQRVLIIGAGVTGLSLGHYLQQLQRHQVTIVESSNRVGGWINTIEEENKRWRFECGPRSLVSRRGEDTLSLIQSLGMETRCVTASSEAMNSRYIYTQKKLVRVGGGGLASMLQLPSLLSLVSGCLHELFVTDQTGDSDCSVFDFFSRRFNESVATQLIDPLCAGIYTGSIHELSVQACFPALWTTSKQHGGIIRGMIKTKLKGQTQHNRDSTNKTIQTSRVYSFLDGMSELPRTLAAWFEKNEGTMELNSPVSSLHFLANGCIRATVNGQETQIDRVFSTVSAHSLHRILSNSAVDCQEQQQTLTQLLNKLSSLHSGSVVVVHVGYSNNKVLPVHGFGLLAGQTETNSLLGISFDSDIFPQHNTAAQQTRLTVIMGGARYPDVSQLSKAQCEQLALLHIKETLGVSETPSVVNVVFHRECIPQYKVGHAHWVKDVHSLVRELSPALSVLGTSVSGVSINELVSAAKRAAAQAFVDNPSVR